ncbi:MAG: DsbA family oxidoreductase, partial [Deltaproteobacteria bacterium]
MQRLRIDIWSDIACPWCYVGKRRLEQALARFP